MACVRPNEAAATTAPKTVVTAATTVTFAAMTDLRAGTAAKVVRICPVLYSPTTVIAPNALTAIIRTSAAFVVKACSSGIPSRTKSARSAASYAVQ
ncbi:hypothetical protein [Streptomyces sp. NPDC020681]|uniref:hypothetical protein n=1 Tax=Streptomyces sp. NPDC020681 TaxID=3365083 RepID=UPI0037B025D1